MKAESLTVNHELREFWCAHAKPGRIGLIELDFAPARILGWAQKRITRDGKPSPWVHAFFFLKPRDGQLWVAESDAHVPLPGFRPKPNGPQENPIEKWSIALICGAAVLETNVTDGQYETMAEHARVLRERGYTYRFAELADTWYALLKHDLTHRGHWHDDHAMHCGHFIRECLRAADADPFEPSICPENTVPELFAQALPAVAEWRNGP